MRYFILFKRANKLVSSFNSEGYILISEGHNREACTFNAFCVTTTTEAKSALVVTKTICVLGETAKSSSMKHYENTMH